MALVGGGKNPEFSPNKVMMWDDHSQKSIGELIFRSPVKGVKLRRESIIIALEYRTYIYNFSDRHHSAPIHEMYTGRPGKMIHPLETQLEFFLPGLV